MAYSCKVVSEQLPARYRNAIIRSTPTQITIRSNLNNLNDIQIWVGEFGVSTYTKWNVEKTFPNGKSMICRKQYVCHHSDFQKVDRDKNKRGLSKNVYCKAKLNCKIKLSTIDTRKKDVYVKQGLCAVITIDIIHSHTLRTAAALNFLPADKETERKFYGYFDSGLSITGARSYHEGILEFEGKGETDLANSRLNPTYRTIQHWFHNWRLQNLGPRNGAGVLDKLREKVNIYAEKGALVRFSDSPFAVVIITSLMKRAHSIEYAKDIVFCDSTSSCDAEQHTITFVLTPCPAGAAPLGVIITQGQSEDSYKAGFMLLKNSLAEIGITGFGHVGYPQYFVTDNSQAEINALKTVWPESENLLCKFHVLQAVWRWLVDSKNKIPEDKRQALMNSFKEIMYANLNDVQSKYEMALSESENEEWTLYLQKYWSIKEKWIVAFRNHTIHGHHTNNYSEVCVRIFKDNVLSRVRAHNVIALIDFVCAVLEKFYVTKFKDFSNSRSSNQRLFLTNTLRKCEYIKEKANIVKLNEHMFIVPSANKDGNNTYTVDTNAGVCTCPQGIFGRFCEHEAAVYKFYDVKSFNFPAITHKHRYEMAFLATGDTTLNESFYQALLPERNGINDSENQHGFLLSDEVEDVRIAENKNAENLRENNTETAVNGDADTLKDEIMQLLRNKLANIPTRYDDLLKFKRRLETTRTEGQLATFLRTAGSQNIKLRQSHSLCP